MDSPDEPPPIPHRKDALMGRTAPLPAFAHIPDTCRLTGLSRSRLYELIGAGCVHAVKEGTRTLVDVASAVAYLHTLPSARVRTPRGFLAGLASGVASGI